MLLSIIIPVYNAEKYIRKCVANILCEEKEEFELILVNDGSTDNSLLICQEIAENDSRVVIVNQKNMGPIAARKTGTKVSKGKYILFVDSDDFIARNTIRKISKILSENSEIDIINYNYTLVDDLGDKMREVLCVFPEGKYDKKMLEHVIYPKMMYYDSFYNYGILPSLVTKVFRRELLERYIYDVPQDVFFGEDGLVTYQCFFAAENALVLNESLYNYRENPTSICRGLNKNRDKLKQCNSLFAAYKNVKPLFEIRYKRQLANYVVYMTWIGLREELLKKIRYPEEKRTLKKIKQKIVLDFNDYVKNQKWIKISLKNRILLYMISHKMMVSLYLYVIYQYRGVIHGK